MSKTTAVEGIDKSYKMFRTWFWKSWNPCRLLKLSSLTWSLMTKYHQKSDFSQVFWSMLELHPDKLTNMFGNGDFCSLPPPRANNCNSSGWCSVCGRDKEHSICCDSISRCLLGLVSAELISRIDNWFCIGILLRLGAAINCSGMPSVVGCCRFRLVWANL